jgi:hypothetical protein
VESGVQPSIDGLPYSPRYNDPSRWRFGFKARSYVYGVTVDVGSLNNNITKVKAHSEHDRLVLGLATIGFDHRLLEIDGSRERVNSAAELDQASITFQPDDPTAATRNRRSQPAIQMVQEP